jgi:hypothetical protein
MIAADRSPTGATRFRFICNWDFKPIEGGHGPMLIMPDELSAL